MATNETPAAMADPRARATARWRHISPGGAVVAVIAVVTATVAARDSAVLATASRYPAVAAKLAPANATAIVHVYDNTVVSSGDLRRNYKGWIAAARQALRADPLNASALRLLAYLTDLLPDGQARARRLMSLSERASRRDVLAQVWLIEDSVRRGDIQDALRHYDRVLTVRPGMAGTLIPILVAAAATPEIRSALVPYLRADRTWTRPFLSVAVSKGQDPAAVADLFRRYGGARTVPSHAEYETRLLARFVNEGNVTAARSFAAMMGMLASAAELRFTPSTTAARFRPLTWTLYEGPDGETSIAPDSGLAVTVGAEKRIVAASRMLVAGSAHLLLRQRVAVADPATAPLVTWQAFCRRVTGPERFWTRDLPANAANQLVQMPLALPDQCDGIQLDLLVTGSLGSSDAKAVIDRLEMVNR